MARGNYGKEKDAAALQALDIQLKMPQRATRQLEEVVEEEPENDDYPARRRRTTSKAVSPSPTSLQTTRSVPKNSKPLTTYRKTKIVDDRQPHPLTRHQTWLIPVVIAVFIAVMFIGVLLSAAISERSGGPQLVNYFGGKAYDVQVGGNLANTWQSNKPLSPKVPIPTGPYSVLGKPTISADSINQILAAYHSPAAGKGQALYDLGVKYNIDPAFALAFFMHESTFGTRGEAKTTMSLGNLRCIPNASCVDQDRGGYAAFPSWEAGFQAWYQLIRNLYVAQWGLTTVDMIIPKYAPTADHDNESAYINSLKHAINTWHAGLLMP